MEKRKLVSFSEFKKHLVPVAHLSVYIARHIPVTIHTVTVDRMPLKLLITVRPLTKKEIIQMLNMRRGPVPSIKEMKQKMEAGLKAPIPGEGISLGGADSNCFPHVRGIVREVRGNRISWYPIMNEELSHMIHLALKRRGINFINVVRYSVQPMEVIRARSRNALEEVMQKLGRGEWYAHERWDLTRKLKRGEITQKNRIEELKKFREKLKGPKEKRVPSRHELKVFSKAWKHIEFPEQEFVSHSDFAERVRKGIKGLFISVVPVRIAGFRETFPLVMRTNPKKPKQPIVLGLFEQGGQGYLRTRPIKRADFAIRINSAISRKVGIKPVTQINYQGQLMNIAGRRRK